MDLNSFSSDIFAHFGKLRAFRVMANALKCASSCKTIHDTAMSTIAVTNDSVDVLRRCYPFGYHSISPCLSSCTLLACHIQVLATHPALTSLRLDGCKIHAEGVAHLATVLAASPSSLRSPSTPAKTQRGPPPPPGQPLLTELGLARNQLGDRGAVVLAGALSSNRNLTSLDLRANGVGMVGCRALGSTLRERNFTLRVLSMTGNEEDIEELKVGEGLWGDWLGQEGLRIMVLTTCAGGLKEDDGKRFV